MYTTANSVIWYGIVLQKKSPCDYLTVDKSQRYVRRINQNYSKQPNQLINAKTGIGVNPRESYMGLVFKEKMSTGVMSPRECYMGSMFKQMFFSHDILESQKKKRCTS